MRPALEVVHRLLALDAARFRLELEAEGLSLSLIASALAALVRRVDLELPIATVTHQEREWVNAPVGSLERHDFLNISWLVECEAVLAWALGLCELPAHDEKTNPDVITDVVPLPGTTFDAMLGLALARKQQEASDVAEFYEVLLWRLRSTPERGARILSPLVRDTVSGLDVLQEGDIPLRGRPAFQYLREDDIWRECHSIALERLRAFRWLFGEDAWDHVNLDT